MNEHAIYLVWEFRAVDGPFQTIEEIPQTILDLVDEDQDYSLVVWRVGDIEVRLRGNPWWRQELST